MNNITERRYNYPNTKTIVFWLTTMFIGISGFISGIGQIFSVDHYVQLFTHLEYPYYFAMITGVYKILGSLVLITPRSPLLKEWAYAGMMFDFTGAVISHLVVGDGITEWIGALIAIAVLIISYFLRPNSRRLIHVFN